MSDQPAIEILIVEDSYIQALILQAAVRALAEPAGLRCEFVVATHVAAARAHLALRQFAAIALDLNLADPTPGEALIPAAGGARVVVLSGLGELLDADRLAAVRALAPAATLAKPTPWPDVARALLAPWLAPPLEEP